MIYALYGNEKFLINEEIKAVINKNEISKLNINTYDLLNNSLKDILEDALTISLFDEKKLIIIENSYIFTGNVPKENQDMPLDELINYFDNINPDCIIIFVVNSDKLDERKKIVKKLHQIATIKNFSKNTNPTDFVKKRFKEYEIDNQVIRLLIDRVGTDLGILAQEIQKIKLYKDIDKTVTKEDIISLTCKNIDIDIFELIDRIIMQDKDKALEIYYEMIKRNEEPIKILIILANQFRIMYQAKELYRKGYSGNDIAGILDIHPYRIKLALEKVYNYSSDSLLNYLSAIADLDYSIKIGETDAALGLELFILGGI